jgi:ubiquitin-protein ligase E3 C
VSEYGIDFTINDEITVDYDTGAKKVLTVNLKPNGANELVTNANRLLYISYVARHRLQVQPFRQTAAFLRGLSAMIKPSWLNMFNQSELQTLIGGTSSSIDVEDLRRNTECSGIFQPGTTGEHPTIEKFWEVMNEFSDTERRAVLKFVTSTPRAPLLGFKTLIPRFTIRDSGSDEMRLPSASTCVNLLKLPMYRSKQVLKDKLLQAANSGAGFDLS